MHQDQLVGLRLRMNWGADPAPAPPQNWHDDRRPIDVVRERIIGENTLRPINYLHKALRAADAVVRVEVPGRGSGTGFLLAADLMVTNHHVIADADQAERAQITFFYELDIDGQKREEVTVGTPTDPLRYTDEGLDVTVISLQDGPKLAHYLPLRPSQLAQDQRVAIIQHPGGFLKKISMQNNLVAYTDGRTVQYYTSTQAGSSGSPVFDDDFAVVAIHHGAIQNDAWDGAGHVRQSDPKQIDALQWRNQGTTASAFIRALKVEAPDLLNTMTVLR